MLPSAPLKCLAAAILHDLRIPRVRLLTNNARKARALSVAGIAVIERVSCEIRPAAHSPPTCRPRSMWK